MHDLDLPETDPCSAWLPSRRALIQGRGFRTLDLLDLKQIAISTASCLTREKLYEAIWGETVSALASKLNVTDADLKRRALRLTSRFPAAFTGQSIGQAKCQLKSLVLFDPQE